ncbi:MAG TPA: ABC transporter ATP-binding protein [Candidatus Hydrogenedentes bacterium]|nr:ABC transporter ATP-binding protein [Candidatus Hydrogenedentota bacterium]HPG67508.1 ABC transporter ATP-binding protein [Candidatus Hydrogenedentota bacterium]
MTDPIIDMTDAAVSYREHVALEGVSMRVHRGEFVGVIGPNGAGKTTLLTVVNGLGRLARGSVRVLGLDPFNGSGHLVRRRVAYVAQVERLDPRLPISVRETVQVGLCGRVGWFRRPSRADRDRVDEALDWVGAAHLAERPIGHLSGGEYQRVAIARALVQDPDIYLFDEPTASIDPKAQREILALIQRVHAQRKTTVFQVTHDLGALAERCQRLVLMKQGHVWRDGPREALFRPALLRDLYDGELAAHARAWGALCG